MSDVQTLDDLVIPITVDYLEEDQVYQVSCPWLQGCHAWGDTLDEAIRAIPENIRAMVDARRTHGSPLPAQLEHLSFDQPFTLRMVPA
jgi:predicted RNase H-like HicB family nuclease